jgi:hypothetical protein
VKEEGNEVFEPLASNLERPLRVFVMYEYPADKDLIGDRNDITWCQIFVEPISGGLVKVFDDETA